MKKIIKSIIKILILWLFISTLVYFLFNITNPDVATVTLRANNISVTKAAIADETHRLGLDVSLLTRYLNWISGVFHGDFGYSYVSNESVASLLMVAIPQTLILSIGAIGLIIVTIFIQGYLTIKLPNHPLEKGMRFLVFILNAIPAFWLGFILIDLFAVKLNIFPTNGNEGAFSFVLPTITLAAMYCGTYARLIRTEINKNRQDYYLKYYYLRGFSKRRIAKALFNNSLRSVLLSLSISIPKIIAGSAVVELLFGWPGIGQVCINAIQNRDLPILEGYVTILSLIFLTMGEIFRYVNQLFVPEMRNDS